MNSEAHSGICFEISGKYIPLRVGWVKIKVKCGLPIKYIPTLRKVIFCNIHFRLLRISKILIVIDFHIDFQCLLAIYNYSAVNSGFPIEKSIVVMQSNKTIPSIDVVPTICICLFRCFRRVTCYSIGIGEFYSI